MLNSRGKSRFSSGSWLFYSTMSFWFFPIYSLFSSLSCLYFYSLSCCYLFFFICLRSRILFQYLSTFFWIQFYISSLGTPCIPNIFKPILSLPGLALGTLSTDTLWLPLACSIIESIDANFFGHLGQWKCLAFWWWWRMTSFLKAFSQ